MRRQQTASDVAARFARSLIEGGAAIGLSPVFSCCQDSGSVYPRRPWEGCPIKGNLMNWLHRFHACRLQWALTAVLALGISSAGAAVNVVARYSLGEADSGALAGAAASGTTPSVGSTTLPAIGSPVYSTAGAPATRPSRLSVLFNGSTNGFRTPAVLTTVTDNFGVEAWVRASSTASNSQVVTNGDSSNSGWGLFRSGANWGFLYGGQTLAATAAPSVDVNTWTHLALVRSGGVNTLYKNGVAVLTAAGTPVTPAGAFSIGVGAPSNGEFFAGNIDEVRVFTFTAGQFATSDLLTGLAYTDPPSAVPANAAPWLLAAALALLFVGAGVLRSRCGR